MGFEEIKDENLQASIEKKVVERIEMVKKLAESALRIKTSDKCNFESKYEMKRDECRDLKNEKVNYFS